MTLPSTPFRADHTGNGTTGPFLYDWKILSNTHLRVIRQVIATGIETVLVLGVDYSVTGVGNDGGGNVNLTDVLPGTEKITILPNVPYEQDTDFTNQNSVKPEEAENMADKLGRQIKQVVEKLGRAVTLPETSTESPTNYINQMNQIYADTIAAKNTTENARDTVLNNAGFIVVSADLLGSDTIGTVAADITNVNTAAGSIANINTVAGSIGSVNIVAADIANVNTVSGNIASVNSAAANMAAIIAAPTQAANAASSAALSQSWAVDAIGARPEGSAKYWAEQSQLSAVGVKITINDTTPGALNDKLVINSGITKTVVNPGGNETLELGVNYYGIAPIGMPFFIFDDLSGAQIPDNSGAEKFIKLTAGEDGIGGFNEGLLDNETIDSSYVDSNGHQGLSVTAEIMVGPMTGERIELINSSEAFIGAREVSGVLTHDQMQVITGEINNGADTAIVSSGSANINDAGAFSFTQADATRTVNSGGSNPRYSASFDSSNSPDARTGSQTIPKTYSATAYMRIL